VPVAQGVDIYPGCLSGFDVLNRISHHHNFFGVKAQIQYNGMYHVGKGFRPQAIPNSHDGGEEVIDPELGEEFPAKLPRLVGGHC